MTRHGQTMHNVRSIVQGHLDSPLTCVGKLQVRMIANFLSDKDINVIVSSSLSRALTTSELIASYLPCKNKVDLITNDLFIERGMGLLEGLPKDVIKEKWENVYLDNGAVNPKVGLEIEPQFNFSKRIILGLREISLISAEMNVLLVSHKGVIFELLKCINNAKEYTLRNPVETSLFHIQKGECL